MSTVKSATTTYPKIDIYSLPTGDGKPMAESTRHAREMAAIDKYLCTHFARDPNVYVGVNMLVYYDPEHPRKSCSPDVFVVKGVPKVDRDIYVVWVEGKAPDVVIEVTSKTTKRQDTGPKKELYRTLGVEELFLFDPTEDYLSPSLQGFRLRHGDYEPVEGTPGRLFSEVLGVEFRVIEGRLRVFDVDREKTLPSHEELIAEVGNLKMDLASARKREREMLAELERIRAEKQ